MHNQQEVYRHRLGDMPNFHRPFSGKRLVTHIVEGEEKRCTGELYGCPVSGQ